jgi:hypothetical protein
MVRTAYPLIAGLVDDLPISPQVSSEEVNIDSNHPTSPQSQAINIYSHSRVTHVGMVVDGGVVHRAYSNSIFL